MQHLSPGIGGVCVVLLNARMNVVEAVAAKQMMCWAMSWSQPISMLVGTSA